MRTLLIGSALALGITVSRALWPLLLFAFVPVPFWWIAEGGMLLAVIGGRASSPTRCPCLAVGLVAHRPDQLRALSVARAVRGLDREPGFGSPLLAIALTFLVATLSWRLSRVAAPASWAARRRGCPLRAAATDRRRSRGRGGHPFACVSAGVASTLQTGGPTIVPQAAPPDGTQNGVDESAGSPVASSRGFILGNRPSRPAQRSL